jgi:hypothetical protein
MNNRLHPAINLEFIEYLIANGYKQLEDRPGPWICKFTRGDVLVVINHRRLIVSVKFDPEPEQRTGGESKIFEFDSIDYLSFFDWALLLHICRVVTIKEMISPETCKILQNVMAILLNDPSKMADAMEAPTISRHLLKFTR